MGYIELKNSREAWVKRQKNYWNAYSKPHFITRIGEIYEIDFGQNIGDEFSGRHLAVCLSNTSPSEDKMLVIPITTKHSQYNISKKDVINTKAINNPIIISGGVVLHEAKWLSKIRAFRTSKILNEPEGLTSFVKGKIKVTPGQLKRWKEL